MLHDSRTQIGDTSEQNLKYFSISNLIIQIEGI
jgi:hypothetical protein